MEYDVCIVGAGPAGLAAAIRFKQASGGAKGSFVPAGDRLVVLYSLRGQLLCWAVASEAQVSGVEPRRRVSA
jgi:hypothetical protein